MTVQQDLVKTVIFEAAPDVVWRFLTDAQKLGAWYHPAESDLEAGQPYRLMGKADDGSPMVIISGEVLEWDPPARLVTTFSIPPFGGGTTTVTWVLKAFEGGTHLTLTHSGITEAAGEAAMSLMRALDQGWNDHLADLRNAAT